MRQELASEHACLDFNNRTLHRGFLNNKKGGGRSFGYTPKMLARESQQFSVPCGVLFGFRRVAAAAEAAATLQVIDCFWVHLALLSIIGWKRMHVHCWDIMSTSQHRSRKEGCGDDGSVAHWSAASTNN